MRKQIGPTYQYGKLEPRQLLASISFDAGVVVVRGTANADLIELIGSVDYQSLTVRINDDPSLTKRFRYADLTQLTVFADGGDDRVTNSLLHNSVIHGGAGNDYIQGGFRDDILYGGDGGDTLVGRSGDDRLYGEVGRDWLYGSGGADQLYGSAGNDRLFGGDGDDELVGNAGNDSLSGSAGNDLLNGNEGRDTLNAGWGNDVVNGGSDHDVIYGIAGVNALNGDDGDDRIYGGISPDYVYGGNGDDLLVGNAGNDRLFGGNGDDVLTGNAGNDRLTGNAGNDFLNGNEGRDTLNGGWGNDVVNGGSDNDLIYGTNGINTLNGNEGDDRIYGGIGNDRLFGEAGDDLLVGLAGNDWAVGGLGNDHLIGSDGDDLLNGNEGDDTIVADEGNDTVNGGTGDDRIIGVAGSNVLNGNGGNDRINGGSSVDHIDGGSGDDSLFGNEGADLLFGSFGNDTLFGGSDDDILDGGIGIDQISGEEGDDEIRASFGDDVLDGGRGVDIVRYFSTAADLEVQRDAENYRVTDLRTINQDLTYGADRLVGIEDLAFGDQANQVTQAIEDAITVPIDYEAINDVLPDHWRSGYRVLGDDIWIRTVDPNGIPQFDFRLGAAGVIAELRDAISGESLLAPTYKGEVTDRVVQWTLWEFGQAVRNDVASLPAFEDRFNTTQAGTFDNVIHGAVDVEIQDQQINVWSVVDRNWKSEQDPFIESTLTSLTQTTILDGGAIHVRRVIRIGEIRLHGNEVTLENPYLEAWTPLSDSTFNAFSLSIDGNGNSNETFIDGQSIWGYPQIPVDETRGWAVAFDRFDTGSGNNLSVVFGTDQGTVHRADGSQTSYHRYNLNSLDFNGGFSILPGLFPGSLAEGSIVEQHLILLPNQTIHAGTGAQLDALAATLPAPAVYHPGAQRGSDIAEIADRLSTLANESRVATDSLAGLL